MCECANDTPRVTRRGLITGALAVGAMSTTAAPALAAGRRPHRVLVYSKTGGFRHASIPVGIQTIQSLGAANGFEVVATEDSAVFTPTNLRKFTAVCFLSTTGEVMTPSGRIALRNFVLDGGGWVGIHSAADTEYDWPFYGRLLAGAWFLAHGLEQPATIVRENAAHLSTAHLPERWTLPVEEYYSFKANPRKKTQVLLSIDESTYLQDPNTSDLPSQTFPDNYHPTTAVMGDHPMAWTHPVGNGLSWYTALGHEFTMWVDASYQQHVLGGLLSASRHGQRHLPA
jgi:type 1 glutamine amidotransferase